MPLEEDVIPTLITCYSLVMIVAVWVVLRLWAKSKDANFAWLLLHFLLFTGGVAVWINLLDQPHPSLRADGGMMLSEDNSLGVALAGFIWALSMFCLLTGVYRLGQNR